MTYENINFQSYCWVLGTTSFRVAQMNLRIEEQLMHLRNFSHQVTERGEEWKWIGNNDLQSSFYYYLREHDALTGDAPRPDKDARQKTSGLPTLGFTDNNRVITAAGHELLNHVEDGSFGDDNYFLIPADSFIYFKQLLKTSLRIREGVHVRPYFVLAYFLNEFGSLSFDELTYLIPLVVDQQSLNIVKTKLGDIRNGNATFDDVIVENLMAKENYKRAYALWMAHAVDEELLTTVGMNRKSREYDSLYFPFYQSLKRVFVDNHQSPGEVTELHKRIKKLKTSSYWKQAIFGDSHPSKINKDGAASLAPDNPFAAISDENQLKKVFFKYLHLYKARANLSDYFDLNRRYFKLTDTVLFRERTVTFDSIPAAFFSLVGDELLADMFTQSGKLDDSMALADISPMFDISEDRLLTALSSKFGVELASLAQAKDAVRDERYERLHDLLDNRFTQEVFLELLDCFIARDDERLKELVTEDATPSTIFEYVLALIWYEFSGRQGDVLHFMKLSFEADLMPRTHAQGGGADIIFDFEKTDTYPEHDMLIEATLADGTNARRMEMEPVSRHLGTHVLETRNHSDYCVFVAPEIDVNVANDFRFRKQSGYWGRNGEYAPLKIIPVDIYQVKQLVEKNSTYPILYELFETAHNSDEHRPLKWREEIASLITA
ncbi:AlwI family type II restriction endonuclease [Brevibacterium ravenspurgense]|uniref:AlwI family type II restriction endonuclease n=1 Tax=Brevibacterium ravenspurgense TaxID=479117 RepID=A0A2I1IG91_9MICO|nr:AlwI family type II restriction endonuclease [Brevibacterium ravenspurgense]PKY70141.1 AlwI family type II restriction endonuclease [Brevibacterium ravenspurgense]